MGTLGFITIKHFALQQDKKYKYKIWEKYLQTTYLIKTLPCRICKKKKKTLKTHQEKQNKINQSKQTNKSPTRIWTKE